MMNVKIFEKIAGNGAYPGQAGLRGPDTGWGGHQPRFAKQKDGTMWMLCLVLISGVSFWELSKRSPVNGRWQVWASGDTYDDVTLLQDSRDGAIYVTAFPAGVWTIFSSRDNFVGRVPVKGDWQALPDSARHYGNTAIGEDGTISFKASRELTPLHYVTDNTCTETISGQYNLETKTWNWGTFRSVNIGNRCAYDYLFVTKGVQDNSFFDVSQSDLHYDAAGFPLLSAWKYIFNGFRFSSGGASVHRQLDDPNASTRTLNIVMRLEDVLMDSSGVINVLYYVQGAESLAWEQGFYCDRISQSGSLLARTKIPTYYNSGNIRIHEDDLGVKRIIYTNTGPLESKMFIYTISVDPISGLLIFTPTDLSPTIKLLAPQAYTAFLAVPRGGNKRDGFIDMILNFRDTRYSGNNYDFSKSYENGGVNLYYMRIQLR